jgi:hypothetical protein
VLVCPVCRASQQHHRRPVSTGGVQRGSINCPQAAPFLARPTMATARFCCHC